MLDGNPIFGGQDQRHLFDSRDAGVVGAKRGDRHEVCRLVGIPQRQLGLKYAATVGFGSFKWRLTRLAAAVLVVWLLTRIGA